MSISPRPSGSPDSAKGSGKRRSTPDRPPSQNIDFEFLNFSHPAEAKASGARRTVRSHVTRQQHQREQQAAAARRTRSFPQGAETTSAKRPPRLKTHHTIAAPDEASPRPDVSPVKSTRSAPSSSVTSTAPSPLPSPGSLSGSGQLEHPYDIYPPAWRPSVSIIIDQYLANLANDNPDLDGRGGQALIRNVWFPFVMRDSTLLHSVLLLATSYAQAINNLDIAPLDPITLRGMALRGINANLQDPDKSLSDATVAAVLTVAVHEAVFGDSGVYATHMHGLQRLVVMRGGLGTLGLGGLLERMVLWADSNASFMTGFNHFFSRAEFSSAVSHPLPDTRQFGARQPSRAYSGP